MRLTSIFTVIGALTIAVSAAPVSNTDAVAGTTNSDIVPGSSSAGHDAGQTSSPPTTQDAPAFTPFFITYPLEDVTYTTGSEITTSWINGIEGPFKINLITGSEPTNMQPTNVFLDVKDGSSGSYTWRIPEKLPNGKYAYKYIYKQDGKDAESYSSQFTITKATTSSAPTKPDNEPVLPTPGGKTTITNTIPPA